MNKYFLLATLASTILISCNNNDKQEDNKAKTTAAEFTLKTADLNYKSDTVNMVGFEAYNGSNNEKRPVVFIIHEWWGLGDYEMGRAKQLAELGYFAVALDLYGNRKHANNPEEASAMAMPFYKDPAMMLSNYNAALALVKQNPMVDTSKIYAIGYCFGGAQVLNLARMGADVNKVVSFHGNLIGVDPVKDKIKAAILVCHGEADDFVPATEIAAFKKQMDSLQIPYTFKSYANATHAFTNPAATETGKKFSMNIRYDAAADSTSWADMKAFLND